MRTIVFPVWQAQPLYTGEAVRTCSLLGKSGVAEALLLTMQRGGGATLRGQSGGVVLVAVDGNEGSVENPCGSG